MIRQSGLRALGLLGLAIVATSCGRLDRVADGGVMLGVVLPLSGPDEPAGQEVLTGMRLAAAAHSGRVTIRAVDGEGEPGPSARRFRELVAESEVRAIAGGWFAATARTLGAVSDSEGVGFIALSPLAAPGAHAAGLYTLHRLESLASASAKFAREDVGAANAGVLVLQGNEASERLAQSFRRTFTYLGGNVAWTISPGSGGKLALPPGPEEEVGVIYVAAHAGWAKRCVALGEKSREAAVMLADGWDPAALPDLVDLGAAVYVASFFTEADHSKAVQPFLTACADNGVPPTSGAALGWDMVVLVGEAAEKGGDSREGIRRFLQSGTFVEGATGRVCPSTVAGPPETAALCSVSPEGLVFLRRIEAVPVPVESEA